MSQSISRLVAIVLLGMLSVAAQAAGLVASCGDRPTSGTRIQYSDENNGQVELLQEHLTLASLTYEFDQPEPGAVRVSYDGEETIGTVVNTDENYKTVTYVYNDVAYMDTLYLNTGIVLSSEHKDGLFGENVVIVWKIDCTLGH